MKINTNNESAVVTAISEVEGKAKARLLYFSDITSAVKSAEKKLESLSIPKNARSGCRVHIYPERVPNKYFGIPEGTFAALERGSRDWFLVTVWRGPSGSCSYGGGRSPLLELSESAKNAIPGSFRL